VRQYQVDTGTPDTALVLGYGNLADNEVDRAVSRLAVAVRTSSTPEVAPARRV